MLYMLYPLSRSNLTIFLIHFGYHYFAWKLLVSEQNGNESIFPLRESKKKRVDYFCLRRLICFLHIAKVSPLLKFWCYRTSVYCQAHHRQSEILDLSFILQAVKCHAASRDKNVTTNPLTVNITTDRFSNMFTPDGTCRFKNLYHDELWLIIDAAYALHIIVEGVQEGKVHSHKSNCSSFLGPRRRKTTVTFLGFLFTSQAR